MDTIRKNTKRVEQIFTHINCCQVYCLNEGFRGRDVDPQVARNELREIGSKLVYNGGDKYTVRVHSNLWYTFRSQG